MDTVELLVSQAREWAGHRSRVLDEGVLGEALELRLRYDGAVATEWPSGSGERLMLVTWPAYGTPPDPDVVHHTMDTFWSFLRATGRMAARSASPAELRKEARRSAPKMLAAYDDPSRHSQGRVLADFGRSVGLDLDGAADVDELNQRLRAIQDAWNDLPQDERIRRMPDPSPKSVRGHDVTRAVGSAGVEPSGRGSISASGEEIEAAARAAQAAPFVQDCLRLVEWVGDGRAVTKAGLLRPSVAREAYQHLELWPWDREHDDLLWGGPGGGARDDPAVDAERARRALGWWTSAGDCFALDRLWYSVEAAGFVEVRSTVARVRRARPTTAREWAEAGLALGLGLAMRAEAGLTTPLATTLTQALAGPQPLPRLRDGWRRRLPASLSDVLGDSWARDLDLMLHVFGDAGLWTVAGNRLTLTTLGAMFVDPFFEAADDGLIETH